MKQTGRQNVYCVLDATTERCRILRLSVFYTVAVNETKKRGGMVVESVEFENG
jgi:hypothetical protein